MAVTDTHDRSLYNEDLAAIPIERRTWGLYNYVSLWVAMSVCIPTYMLASGLIAGGMRKGVLSMEPASENLRLMANLTIQIGTDKTWEQYFGGMQYTLVKREKLNVLTFYLGGKNVMLVSAEPDFGLDDMNRLRDTLMTIYSTGIVPEKVKK